MKKINNDKLKQLSFAELYNIFNFLNYELERCEEGEREIYKKRIDVVEEELKCIVNNLF